MDDRVWCPFCTNQSASTWNFNHQEGWCGIAKWSYVLSQPEKQRNKIIALSLNMALVIVTITGIHDYTDTLSNGYHDTNFGVSWQL